ncbi:MAG TPA: 4-(cytidine 5'-diphospho)-2-C-methyl-D-erythritol kinase [Stellaceae bacterium]|nr:4-(cytidine 5'-diphospho)-2-C-methyl-D-erythritol kinase [Stellaceae bacterium]
MAVRRAAPAKLNLYLHVTGRRPDGYHLLDSLVAFADIGDELVAEPAPALSLAVEGSFAAALADENPASNLVWRAATALAERAGRPPAVALTLRKSLPVASGIGGGSSDAAATLSALAELWSLDLAAPRFAGLATALGADVPVCLMGRTAWLGGIGEELAPAPALPAAWVVLANPGVAVATPAVFKARRGPFSAPARFESRPADAAALARLLAARRNDLTDAAIGIAPEIAEVLEALGSRAGALITRMCGSGATCYALFAEEAAARVTAAALGKAQPRWWVAAARLL